MARKRALSADPQGRYRPYIGWYFAADGQRRQRRFNLGTDRRDAERRYNRIHDLYADDCRETGQDRWSAYALRHADQLAAGVSVIRLTPPPAEDRRALVEYQQALEQDRQRWPSLELSPSDLDVFHQSSQLNDAYVRNRLEQLQAELHRMGALLSGKSLPEKLIPGNFHEALDAYIVEIRRDSPRLGNGELNQTGRKRIERVERIKAHHQDFPLYEFGKDKIAEIIGYWRNRPKTKRKTTCAYDTARIHLEELDRFLGWLDDSERFGWTLPKGVKKISRKIVRLNEEKKLSAVVKVTYTPDQLAAINRTATNRERLALYLGLNAAMGAAELGRLAIDDFSLNTPHPFARKLGIPATQDDSWLRCFRNKTGVFGEWILWPETVELVRWAIARSMAIGSELIFVRETGAPLFDESITKPDAGFANLWSKAYARAKAMDEDLPWCPFGSLRDTLPDYLRAHHDTELASICLAHGKPADDKLIECYANRPFARLHEAIREARHYFAPVFEHHHSPDQIERVG